MTFQLKMLLRNGRKCLMESYNWIHKNSMNVLIAGDFTTEDRGMVAVLRGDAISDEIKSIIKEADFSIVNLEAPLAKDGFKPLQKSGPNLKTAPQTVLFLKECGFQAVTLANNHFCDYGKEGVNLTIDQLDTNGIEHVGGGRSKEELRLPLIHHSADGDISFLNYCEHEFSIQDGYGSNALNTIQVFYDIQKAKKESDIVIVIIHGGSEGYQLPSPRMKEWYRAFVDMGANAVINHHQHCYSGFEKYHNGFIFYGLGNFFFDDVHENNSIWNEGYMVTIDIQERSIKNIKLIPYEQCQHNVVQVILMKAEKKDAFFKNIDFLNSLIKDDEKLNNSFLQFLNEKEKNYLSAFSPYSNRYLRYLCKHRLLPSFFTISRQLELINYIECESHRDMILCSLKNNKCHES